jgi:hypothetical protein
MRGKVIAAGLLLCAVALPVCAQRRGFGSSPRVGGSIAMRSHGPVGMRGGISFGRNPRFSVFVNSRPRYPRRRYYSSPYLYSYPYVSYPYGVYPAYPLPLYDSYAYSGIGPQPAYPAYADEQQVGLAEQMRQQNVGIYRRYPYSTDPSVATTAQPAPAPEPDRPPTVLVYRDGQRAEIGNYAVVGQTLWIFSEDRAKKVPLAQLDLDATRKANDDRGVEFAVPAVR